MIKKSLPKQHDLDNEVIRDHQRVPTDFNLIFSKVGSHQGLHSQTRQESLPIRESPANYLVSSLVLELETANAIGDIENNNQIFSYPNVTMATIRNTKKYA